MIAVALASLGLRTVLGVDPPGGVGAAPLAVAVVTFALMVGLNVWTQGATRLFCALIGALPLRPLKGTAGARDRLGYRKMVQQADMTDRRRSCRRP